MSYVKLLAAKRASALAELIAAHKQRGSNNDGLRARQRNSLLQFATPANSKFN